ncbi:sensor histidine kinase [Paenibacillus sp. LjRoot153]|uniref:sensor histidine kinase n=1 Tax=Paenibacillus sp. LjRoot153 TaxID=3342270 RepID=UPI003ED1569D
MRLFWKEHVPLVFMYAGQLLLTVYMCRLSGFRNTFDLAYICMVNTALFAFYLIYRYIRHFQMYQRLTRPLSSLDESAGYIGNAPLADALGHLLQEKYRLYQNDIERYRKKLTDHVTFINQWVHQMKTPLSVMHLAVQQETDPFFDSMREEIDKLKKGLDTVLYTSRLDAFEQDFVAEPVALRQLVGKVAAEHKNLWIRNKVFPEIQVDDGLMVMSDDKWLAFALGQLITNAVRYSAGLSSRIMITSEVQGQQVVLEIRDHGVGIPKQDIKRVFDAYFTGENGRRFGESTGMGLYLVREIASRLDHHVELESEQGQGTAVRIWMRIAHVQAI